MNATPASGLTRAEIDAHIERQPIEEKLTCNYCQQPTDDFVVDAELSHDHVLICESPDCIHEAANLAFAVVEGVAGYNAAIDKSDKAPVSKSLINETKVILTAFADYIG